MTTAIAGIRALAAETKRVGDATAAVGTNAAVEAARAEVNRLHDVELQWSDRLAAAKVKLAEAEATAGGDALAGADVSKLGGRLANVKGEIATCEAAISEARQRRRAAISAVYAAEGAALRPLAEHLRTEAQEHGKRAEQLLGALQAHEECAYAPVAVMMAGVLPADGKVLPLPKSARMFSEAEALDASARQREGQAVQVAGQLVAVGIDELLAQVRAVDAMIIGPALASVEDWARARWTPRHETRARQHAQTGEGLPAWEKVHHEANRPAVLTMCWRDGAIDEGASGVSKL